MSEVIRYMW